MSDEDWSNDAPIAYEERESRLPPMYKRNNRRQSPRGRPAPRYSRPRTPSPDELWEDDVPLGGRVSPRRRHSPPRRRSPSYSPKRRDDYGERRHRSPYGSPRRSRDRDRRETYDRDDYRHGGSPEPDNPYHTYRGRGRGRWRGRGRGRGRGGGRGRGRGGYQSGYFDNRYEAQEYERSRDRDRSPHPGHSRGRRTPSPDDYRPRHRSRDDRSRSFNGDRPRSPPSRPPPRRVKREEDNREYEWGGGRPRSPGKQRYDDNPPSPPPQEKEKPNFGLSGKLTEDTNKVNGVVIKYAEPPEARKPKRRWRLYPFKGQDALPTMYIHRQSAYLIGRDRKICDLPVDHPSCSKQHAVLQYRLVNFERDNGTVGKRVRPYIIDLESANGTFLNNKRIEAKKFIELMERDVLKFGFSSREYVLLHENSHEDQEDDDVGPLE